MTPKYINPFTDFGFKKIFGEEASKPILIDFLKSLLPEADIIDLHFKDKTQLGTNTYDRKAVYDIYCKNNNDETIIVELQKAKQKFFKDRTIFYASFPIQEQAEKGEWDYQLKSIFCVGILDFRFDDNLDTTDPSHTDVVHTVQLKNQHNQVFYNKLKFVYLEMPNLKKKIHELHTRLDKWLYFIKHLEAFDSIPEIFKDEIFAQAFTKAEIANYTQTEREQYQDSLKSYRDLKGVLDTAFDEGKMEGKKEIAKQLKILGVDNKIISKSTGLSENEINNL